MGGQEREPRFPMNPEACVALKNSMTAAYPHLSHPRIFCMGVQEREPRFPMNPEACVALKNSMTAAVAQSC